MRRLARARILIRRATIADVYKVAARMRPADAAEATVLGKDPRQMLRRSFRASILARTLVLDGQPAAIGGIGGDMLTDTGTLWLLTSDAVERAPLAFVRAARRELAAALKLRGRLEGYVTADYAKAIRFLLALGFTLDAPVPVGRKGALFRRFWIEAAP